MYCKFLDLATKMAKEVGKIHLSYFRGDNLGTLTKDNNVTDLVTRADKESEEYIVKTILEAFPDHKILGEEGGFQGNQSSDYLWVVDPLDGTTNFSQGLPIFAVSIGLMHREETIVGVVYAPYIKEMFWAVKGGGAYMQCEDNDPVKIKVSDKESLNCSLIGTGFPYDKHTNPENNSQNVARILSNVRDIRRMGAAAYDLCAVAAGLLDGYWEMSLGPWDACAGCLIVEQAGGEVFHYRSDRKISIIVGNPKIVSLMRNYIK